LLRRSAIAVASPSPGLAVLIAVHDVTLRWRSRPDPSADRIHPRFANAKSGSHLLLSAAVSTDGDLRRLIIPQGSGSHVSPSVELPETAAIPSCPQRQPVNSGQSRPAVFWPISSLWLQKLVRVSPAWRRAARRNQAAARNRPTSADGRGGEEAGVRVRCARRRGAHNRMGCVGVGGLPWFSPGYRAHAVTVAVAVIVGSGAVCERGGGGGGGGGSLSDSLESKIHRLVRCEQCIVVVVRGTWRG